ncbi:AtpZ/AtpI family protein [Paradesulfitobacterium ferrireducens]|uniref:AtpZ/AtpI family protein n=1 Tax=Paradesulfitobacterium ferrireducens TaxID=2816476 RepID=UPI001A90B822|nr:AtpZ/AtpI family protein [Paradesulfitobacterium ferrireducens]
MAENRKTWLKAVSFGTSIATTLAGLVGGGYFFGRFLDRRWGFTPWLELVFMLVGLVFGGAYLVTTLKKFGMTDGEE